MNILCLCDGGFVRSVALAYVINTESKEHCAIAGGLDSFERNEASKELLLSLVSIEVQKVLVVSEDVGVRLLKLLPSMGSAMFTDFITLNIGPDRWGTKLGPYNDELLELCYNELKRVGIL